MALPSEEMQWDPLTAKCGPYKLERAEYCTSSSVPCTLKSSLKREKQTQLTMHLKSLSQCKGQKTITVAIRHVAAPPRPSQQRGASAALRRTAVEDALPLRCTTPARRFGSRYTSNVTGKHGKVTAGVMNLPATPVASFIRVDNTSQVSVCWTNVRSRTRL